MAVQDAASDVAAGSAPAGGAGRATPRRRLGVLSVVFMIIAASAPLTVVAGGFTTSYALTKNTGLPLSYLIIGAALAVWSVGYVHRF